MDATEEMMVLEEQNLDDFALRSEGSISIHSHFQGLEPYEPSWWECIKLLFPTVRSWITLRRKK